MYNYVYMSSSAEGIGQWALGWMEYLAEVEEAGPNKDSFRLVYYFQYVL